jgi:hypothetical protein
MDKSVIEAGRQAIQAASAEAIETVLRVMRQPKRNAATQLAAALAILNRAGLPEVMRAEIAGDENSPITIKTWAEVLREKQEARRGSNI